MSKNSGSDTTLTHWIINGWNPKNGGLVHLIFLFNLADFWVNQPFIFRGVLLAVFKKTASSKNSPNKKKTVHVGLLTNTHCCVVCNRTAS